jgi:hypothetical protein
MGTATLLLDTNNIKTIEMFFIVFFPFDPKSFFRALIPTPADL